MPAKKKFESSELEFLLALVTDPLQREIISLMAQSSDPDQAIEALLRKMKDD